MVGAETMSGGARPGCLICSGSIPCFPGGSMFVRAVFLCRTWVGFVRMSGYPCIYTI